MIRYQRQSDAHAIECQDRVSLPIKKVCYIIQEGDDLVVGGERRR